jgi:hypothetical protein
MSSCSYSEPYTQKIDFSLTVSTLLVKVANRRQFAEIYNIYRGTILRNTWHKYFCAQKIEFTGSLRRNLVKYRRVEC